MTFNFKCDCGAALLVVVNHEQDAMPVVKANDWKMPKSKSSKRAWTDEIPAICPSCCSTIASALLPMP